MKRKPKPKAQAAIQAPPKAPGVLRTWSGLVGAEGGGRVDKFISETKAILSRSQIKAREARILVNGTERKVSYPVKPGDKVELQWTEEGAHDLEPQELDVKILYEDAEVFVFDKAQGMVTHPAAGNWTGTLANAVLWLEGQRSGLSGAPRGGIVHRLDKDTSGAIIVARNARVHEFLAAQFKDRLARKEYWALVRGFPGLGHGRIENRLGRDPRDRKKFAPCLEGGKTAVTDYKTLASWEFSEGSRYSLVALFPRTGRTHQLRVHMASIRCPILGDPIYSKPDSRFPEATLMLHARRLRIQLPSKEAPSLFKAPLPLRFKHYLNLLETRATRSVLQPPAADT
jgi:23S rRNA pseudouridine1911/1915/1917 synthase